MQVSDVMGISAVEQDTGLSKDKLRTWERRYGFPRPLRDARGERVYPRDQVEKLRIVRRLMDAGFRPGAIMQESLENLRVLGIAKGGAAVSPRAFAAEIDAVLHAIKAHDFDELRNLLHLGLARLGIRQFVTELVASLNEAVGVAWARGEISIAEEHLYSAQIKSLLHSATNQIMVEARGPRILLTTLPGEPHGLGLLMLQAILTIELAKCIQLGTQTPISAIVEIAKVCEADVVAVSFSSSFPKRTALSSLDELRAALPGQIAVWAGGDGVQRVRKRPHGIVMPMTLSLVSMELEKWRTSSHPEVRPV